MSLLCTSQKSRLGEHAGILGQCFVCTFRCNFEGEQTGSRGDGAEFGRELVIWVSEDLLQFAECCFLDV